MKFKLLALAAALATSACTMIPRYQRPASPVITHFPGATAVKALPASEISWRDFIGDERLRALVNIALTSNRDLRVAILNVEQSRAQYRVTRSALYPQIDASANFTRAESSAAGSGPSVGGNSSFTSNQWNASIGTTSYEVDLFGRLRSLDKQALEKFFATSEARRAAQVSLVAELAIEYFTWREADEELQLSRHTLQAVQESYSLNKAMFDAGASTELDLREAESQALSAKIAMTTYERQKAEAENYLTLLVGQPLPAALPKSRSFTDANLLAEIPADLPSELIERRPDVLEAEHTLKAANANIGAARAAFFPRITLTNSIGTTSTQLSELFRAGTGVWSFAPQITLPIFTGGQNMADLDAAKISKRIEIANYEKAIQTAFREVSDALADMGNYAKQRDEQSALASVQQRRYDLAHARYLQGDDTYLNSLTAQQDLFSAQQGFIQAQFNKLVSQIALYKALGGGWQ